MSEKSPANAETGLSTLSWLSRETPEDRRAGPDRARSGTVDPERAARGRGCVTFDNADHRVTLCRHAGKEFRAEQDHDVLGRSLWDSSQHNEKYD